MKLTTRQALSQVLQYARLLVFVLIPFRLTLIGVPAIVFPIWLSLAAWLFLGAPGLRTALQDRRRWWLMALMLFIGWTWLSVLWSIAPDVSIRAAQGLTLAALFAGMVACDRCAIGLSLRHIAGALMIGLLVQSVVVVVQANAQHPLGLSVFGEIDLSIGQADTSTLSVGAETWMRPYGLTAHPNILGGYMAVGLLAVIGLYLSGHRSGHRSEHPRFLRAVIVLSIALGIWALGLSFSRAAWIGFGVGFAVLLGWLALRRASRVSPVHRRSTAWLIGLIVLTIGLFTIAYGRFIGVRVDINSARQTVEQRSISDRRYYMGIALQAFAEHPLAGLGAGALLGYANEVVNTGPYAAWMKGDYVHNVPLLILAELGAVGLALWLLSWAIGVIGVAHRWHNRTAVNPDPLVMVLLASTVTLLVIGLFDHYPYTTRQFDLLMWALTGILLNSDSKPANPERTNR